MYVCILFLNKGENGEKCYFKSMQFLRRKQKRKTSQRILLYRTGRADNKIYSTLFILNVVDSITLRIWMLCASPEFFISLMVSKRDQTALLIMLFRSMVRLKSRGCGPIRSRSAKSSISTLKSLKASTSLSILKVPVILFYVTPLSLLKFPVKIPSLFSAHLNKFYRKLCQK